MCNDDKMYYRVATPHIEYEEFKKEVDRLTKEYFESDNKWERNRQKTRIIELYLYKDGPVEYYWRERTGKNLSKGVSTEAEEAYLEEFMYVLLNCFESFDVNKSASFRTYFETAINNKLNSIFKKNGVKNTNSEEDNPEGKTSSIVISLDADRTGGDGDACALSEIIEDESGLSVENKTEDIIKTEALMIKSAAAISNFYSSAGDSERARNKKRIFSTLHTSNTVGILRNIHFSDLVPRLEKNEREITRSLNGELINYTYSEKVNRFIDLVYNHLKLYRNFDNVISSRLDQLDSEIETPFEQFIIINFYNDIYHKVIKKESISQETKKFREYLSNSLNYNA